ncbi:MAG: alpha-glucan family phosphorylase [Pirellulales bacterium]|nr:alpha-glucan family phosphorylase [Pirellulales bacterium]
MQRRLTAPPRPRVTNHLEPLHTPHEPRTLHGPPAGEVVDQSTTYGRLWTLAQNLWWTWHPEVMAIFRDLEPVRWRQLDHNPVALLSEFSAQRLEQRANELVLHSRIHYAYRRLNEYLHTTGTWADTHVGMLRAKPVAYFSAEFGLHESLPIYSGGLGVLAGDHLKSASDLGVPLVAVGLFYDQGYFNQRLNRDGWQQEEYLDVEVGLLPITPARTATGEPLTISIATRGHSLLARVWEVRAGRCRLLLLDSDIEGNRMEDREVTARLYGGDHRCRLRQELLLGVGGVKALTALGIRPGVLHLNEGHSAFATLELTHDRMCESGLSFEDAAREVAQLTTFTTHTPVPAGHDRFSAGDIEEHLGPLRDSLGLSHDELMRLGRVDSDNPQEPFCMTVLALKMSRRANGVSAEHGRVSRRMWQVLWPQRDLETVPIGHITNGVHIHSWLAPQMHQLFDRHLGTKWHRYCGQAETWAGIDAIPDGEIWETHQVLKLRLIDFVRRRSARTASRRGQSIEQVEAARAALSPDTLLVGFGRRFATYKRATLLATELDRLAALVNSTQRPVQFVYAGKAHPHDEPGKQLLWEIAQLTTDPRFIGKFVFVEDYDINVGRHLVQGVDVWLNTPRRPLEASGTSGQKVVLNGGLNLSVLDGWWAEAYDGLNGFAIGKGQTHVAIDIQDSRDSDDLYDVLEQQVLPLYYDRDRDGIPVAWIARMKHAMRTLGWRFSADRMVMEYAMHAYLRAAGGMSCDMP